MKKLLFITLSLLALLSFSSEYVFAQEVKDFITVVNPVRVSDYNTDLGGSIQSQYSVVKSKRLPATWLLTFDVLKNEEALKIIKSMNSDQEIGIFLEVTKNFAEAAGIQYNDSGFWHHANSVFLSGYSQEKRVKMIDHVFGEFKEKLGYYPLSVGSWWTDSFSLNYMKEKYGITANLGCADQFSTDGYKIWGQYWSTPYYPSKYHAGIPASDKSVKLDLVTIQWAPRDPLNGYQSSLFSTQDYLVSGKEIDTEYFKELVNIYLLQEENEFGQMTIGLEGDLPANIYEEEYSKQLDYAKELDENSNVEVVTMKQFSDWYRNKFSELSPEHTIRSNDLLGNNIEAVWYQNPKYRISYTSDVNNAKSIRDLRVYGSSITEPYYVSPNREFTLSIYNPSVLDEINSSESRWDLGNESEILTERERIVVKTKAKIPDLLKKSEYIDLKRKKDNLEFIFKEVVFAKGGLEMKDYSVEALHFFKQPRFILSLLTGKGWQHFKKIKYLIPQGELHALEFLSKLPKEKVLVFDRECLQCKYHTEYKPPFFANLRSYVRKLSKKPIVYNSSIFNIEDRKEVEKQLRKTGVKYIYLVKFEGYLEKLPFSPGDLKVEKIYDNANAEIWKVK